MKIMSYFHNFHFNGITLGHFRNQKKGEKTTK